MSAGTFSWEDAVAERARAIGLPLDAAAVSAIVVHAQCVRRGNERLHLTSIDDPRTFVNRHIGESLQGAALLDEGIAGTLVDLGSGNGYPGIPVAIARPRLTACLVESSEKKAAFLRDVLTATGVRGSVVGRHVTRGQDLSDLEAIDLLVTRAMGDWERVVPRVAAKLSPRGRILLWAGADADRVLTREAWRRWQLVTRLPLAERERSFIFLLARPN